MSKRTANDRNNLMMNILQSIIIALSLGGLTGLWRTYMDVHDLKKSFEEQKGKVDWLYRYNFPHMKEDKDDE